MDVKDLIRAGRLQEARVQVTEEVKAFPADVGRRTLLIQVLSFCGEWDKAERHLDMLATLSPQSETGIQVYRNLISAERKRMEVMQGRGRPAFMTEMPEWLESHFLGMEKFEAGDVSKATRLFEKIEEKCPAISGSLNGTSFNAFRDCDDFLSGFLEVFIHDSYLWFPFGSLRGFNVSPPKTLFDLLWAPARVMTGEGLELTCFLPVVYPGSFSSEDDLIRLGRMTEWNDVGGGFYKGVGQHLFLVGGDDKGLLELGEVTFTFREKDQI